MCVCVCTRARACVRACVCVQWWGLPLDCRWRFVVFIYLFIEHVYSCVRMVLYGLILISRQFKVIACWYKRDGEWGRVCVFVCLSEQNYSFIFNQLRLDLAGEYYFFDFTIFTSFYWLKTNIKPLKTTENRCLRYFTICMWYNQWPTVGGPPDTKRSTRKARTHAFRFNWPTQTRANRVEVQAQLIRARFSALKMRNLCASINKKVQ